MWPAAQFCEDIFFLFHMQIYDSIPMVRYLPLPFQKAFKLFKVREGEGEGQRLRVRPLESLNPNLSLYK